jgi:hypothetical protein
MSPWTYRPTEAQVRLPATRQGADTMCIARLSIHCGDSADSSPEKQVRPWDLCRNLTESVLHQLISIIRLVGLQEFPKQPATPASSRILNRMTHCPLSQRVHGEKAGLAARTRFQQAFSERRVAQRPMAWLHSSVCKVGIAWLSSTVSYQQSGDLIM